MNIFSDGMRQRPSNVTKMRVYVFTYWGFMPYLPVTKQNIHYSIQHWLMSYSPRVALSGSHWPNLRNTQNWKVRLTPFNSLSQIRISSCIIPWKLDFNHLLINRWWKWILLVGMQTQFRIWGSVFYFNQFNNLIWHNKIFCKNYFG